MESFIRSPDPLKDNSPSTWIIWKEEFLIFMGLLDYMERSQSFKANLFKNLIGSVGLAIINKLSFDHIEDKDNLDILLQKLDNYYNPQQTEAQKRNTFFNTTKKNDETIENYIQKLKERAQVCNFGNLTDSLVRDVIILHTHDKILRKKFLQDEKLDFNKIIAIYKKHKIQELKSKTSDDKYKGFKEKKNKEVLTKQKDVLPMPGSCWRCNTKHPIKQCPAWNYKCTKCNRLHHFEKCCKDVLQATGESLNMNDLNINSEKYVKKFYNVNKNVHGMTETVPNTLKP